VTTEERLDELRLHSQELRRQGQVVSAVALCSECPELTEALERKLKTVDYWESFLGLAEPDQEPTTTWPPNCANPGVLPDTFPGEFRVLRRLGAGGFGTVWLAEDLHLGRLVALKTVRLPSTPKASASYLLRLREEARLLAAVRHRNVVEVYSWRETPTGACTTAEQAHYLVLQYVPGGSLEERVQRQGPLPWQLAARYIADVSDGLLQVHARGIVHRDVKPANILWDPEADEAVLTDFGISARMAEDGVGGGTPYYIPPEAFQGWLTPAQDVYGLTASLFWLMTGSVPFPAATLPRMLEQVHQGLPDLEPRCMGMPQPLERLVRLGLSAEPGSRPSLNEFATALRGELNQLLADSLLLEPKRPDNTRVQVCVRVSRWVDRRTFLPVITTRPQHDRFLRDMQRVPREPECVEVYTGDQLRVEVETNRAGYLTVFNIGPTGNLNLICPEQAHMSPVVMEAGSPLHVLDIGLTPPAGRERLFALWTRVPLPLRLDELRSLAERGEMSSTGPYRATRDMARVQESVQSLASQDWQAAVLELNHRPTYEYRL
jgi:serine/threonine-protein kinase